jgi:5'-nucleotidase (lipoprotein e(P4) family)
MRFRSLSLISLLICASAFAQGTASGVAPEPSWTKVQANSLPCAPGNALLNAALWVQNSAEYKANALQTYASARRALDAAKKDTSWSATGQTDVAKLPAAVILDLDETALNNIEFEARVIRSGVTYTQKTWDEWTSNPEAAATPGAGTFLAYAKNTLDVTPFYITNRKKSTDVDEEVGTRANLKLLGYPLVTVPDTPGTTTDNLLVRGERPDWSSKDKAVRRDWVSARYRVLLLIGDDLNDFVSAADKTEAQRDQIIADTSANWGVRWFILPNPMYGSWHDALLSRPIPGSDKFEKPRNGCDELQWKLEATKPDVPSPDAPTP